MKDYKAGIYLRLSKEDNNPNNSISSQREIVTNYAKKEGFSIIKEYVDNGWSGILDSRPAFNEMIFDILHKKIDMLIVKDLSRLTRDKNKTGNPAPAQPAGAVFISARAVVYIILRHACAGLDGGGGAWYSWLTGEHLPTVRLKGLAFLFSGGN